MQLLSSWSTSQGFCCQPAPTNSVHALPFPPLPELLRRTEEKREERRKERLDDYYRRNYGDYLSFQVGPGQQLPGGGWLAVGAAGRQLLGLGGASISNLPPPNLPCSPLPQAGSVPASDTSANQQKIREWLERNLEPALPFEAAAARRQQEAGAAGDE